VAEILLPAPNWRSKYNQLSIRRVLVWYLLRKSPNHVTKHNEDVLIYALLTQIHHPPHSFMHLGCQPYAKLTSYLPRRDHTLWEKPISFSCRQQSTSYGTFIPMISRIFCRLSKEMSGPSELPGIRLLEDCTLLSPRLDRPSLGLLYCCTFVDRRMRRPGRPLLMHERRGQRASRGSLRGGHAIRQGGMFCHRDIGDTSSPSLSCCLRS